MPDIGLEAALTKIYCTEYLKSSIDSCLEILAMGSYTKLSETQNRYLLVLYFISEFFKKELVCTRSTNMDFDLEYTFILSSSSS